MGLIAMGIVLVHGLHKQPKKRLTTSQHSPIHTLACADTQKRKSGKAGRKARAPQAMRIDTVQQRTARDRPLATQSSRSAIRKFAATYVSGE